jgi:uncharacterized protein YceK
MAPRHVRPMAAVLLVLVCAAVLAGCGSDPRLQSLQGDPMARATLPNTTLQHEYKTKTHTALGMPVHAQVLRAFTFSGVDPKVLVDEGAALATKNGWKQEFRRSTGYIGSKQIGDVGARLSITAGGASGSSTFVIALTADETNG